MTESRTSAAIVWPSPPAPPAVRPVTNTYFGTALVDPYQYFEHLADPAWALDAYLGRLKPGGTVLVSLPNVGLWSVRLGLLLGRWNYSDTGVLDRTHLRFFTWRTARALLAAAGIRPLRRTLNPGLARPFIPLAKRFLVRGHGERRPDPMTMLNSGAYRWYLRLVHPTERLAAWLWPGGLAFQMVFEGKVEET